MPRQTLTPWLGGSGRAEVTPCEQWVDLAPWSARLQGPLLTSR